MRMQFITPFLGFYWLICLKEIHFSSAGISECSQVPQPCGPNTYCLDNERSFSCMCLPGYSSSKGDSFLPGSLAPLDCSDIDECSGDPSPCGLNSICTNTLGSYTCTCEAGCLPASQPGVPCSCTDIDECSRDPSPCGPNSTCSNTLGSYTCTCLSGYLPPSKSGAPFSCTDIDECARDPSPCGPNSICTNTPGSYTCRCQAGYLPLSQPGAPFSCTDIDECSHNPSPCRPKSICRNTLGSYTCTCQGGYLLLSQPDVCFNCTGINKCSQVPQPCGPNTYCLDNERSFSCKCFPGYNSSKGDSFLPDSVAPLGCSEIDECSRNPSPCGPNSICTNTPGSYTCMCQEGYIPPNQSGAPFNCIDIDECSHNPCPCGPDSICNNTPGSYTCSCQAGYLLLSKSGTPFSCTDVDECSQDPSPCGPDSICTNTPGSYTCRCRAGYLPPSQPGAPFSCTDIDECSRDPSPCGPNSICTNTLGSYTCTGQAGHIPPSQPDVCFNCTEINECSQIPQPCGPNTYCLNNERSFSCMCLPGYSSSKGDSFLPGSVAPLDCSDIDECSQRPSPCGPNSICNNILGSYTCRCRAGYMPPSQPGTPFSCTDIDECSHDPSPCGHNSNCSNTLGSYTCTCLSGYLPPSKSGVPFSCTDIDECARDPSPCGPNSLCSNTPGSYTCRCWAGYLPPSQPGTPFSCTDIDECSRDPSPCGPNSICTNTLGNYTCKCQRGYLPPSEPDVCLSCTDIDECSRDPSLCGPNSICTNTPGSYTCTCQVGYITPSQPGAPFNCTDVNECSKDPSPCGPNSICNNTLGSYTCTCRAGYIAPSQPDISFNCTDIDECSRDPSLCGPNSICTNTPGSYTCTCHVGYITPSQPGAPFNCTDIDECSRDPSLCGPNSICTNTPGSYTCTCQVGYITPSQPGAPFNCTDIDECARDPSLCGPNSICSNTPGSYTCTCEVGYITPSQPGAPFNCTEVTSKCKAQFSEKNDSVRKSQNQSLDTAHGSSPEDAAYCTLLKSTFSTLGESCGEKNSTVCLEKAAGGFASVLEQTSSWSNLSTEQLSVSATIILQSVEKTVMDVVTNPTKKGNLTIRTEQLDVQSKVIGDDCSREDSVVSLGAKGESMEIRCKTVQGSTAQGAAGVAFASYEGMEKIMNSSFFHDENATSGRTVRMNSRVVSAWLSSETKTNFTDPVNYTFKHIKPSIHHEKPICVSWEITAQGGSWSKSGCKVLRSNTTHTTCNCNHVSSLAVLMAWGEITAEFPLYLISHVGLVLSLLCLLFTILTFLLCRSIRNVNTSIHLQLCLCLFLADLLFLTAVDSTRHQVGCAVIAGFLHYLFLACFAWMFLEAVVLFLTVRNLGVVNYFSTHSPKMWFLSLFGYGFPALVVAISAAIMPNGYGRQENCWLSMERGFIWSFLGPVCVIVGINSVLFTLTLWMLQRKLSSLNSEVSTLKDIRLLTFKAIAQVFILGCTWIFGLFQTGPATAAMAYLFIILNSPQGVFIFLVHCLLNRQVREEYKRWFTGKSKSYSEISMSTLATSSKVG